MSVIHISFLWYLQFRIISQITGTFKCRIVWHGCIFRKSITVEIKLKGIVICLIMNIRSLSIFSFNV